MRVLGIETSCDETGVALFDEKNGLLGHRLYSQVAKHAPYGGVVPELASRDHVRKLIPLVDELMRDQNQSPDDIDAVAYTAGPGLIGALLVGASTGRALAWAWGAKAVAVHHMEGHLLATLIDNSEVTCPFVALLVSGGHTLLVAVEEIRRYQLLGDTLDDAVGEAFDKTAKLLGLGYPGGPALSKLAQSGRDNRFAFPRPMTKRPGLDFSFSGLKTAALTVWRDHKDNPNAAADVAASFQQAVVDTLIIKCRRALKQTGFRRLIVAGGVGANQPLRAQLKAAAEREGWSVHYPPLDLCTDNGAMIAYAGLVRLRAGADEGLPIWVRPRWPLVEVAS